MGKVVRRVRVVSAAVVLAASAGACSSSSKANSVSGTTVANTGSTGTSAPASGSPIKIATWASYTNPAYSAPEKQSAAEAAVDAINAAGGVNGHPLQVVTCDTDLDPNKTTQCTQQAISDHVVAVVDAESPLSGTPFTLLQNAGIAYIFGQGLTPTEISSPISFPLAGTPGWFYGVAAMLVKQGAKHIAIVGGNSASDLFAAQLITAALKTANVTPVRSLIVPLNTTDYTATAATAMEGGVDGIAYHGSEQQLVPLVTALRQQGYKGYIDSISADVSDTALQSMGSAANGMGIVSLTASLGDTSNPAVAAFLNGMKQYEPSAKVDTQSEEVWSAVELFAAVAKTLPTVDASTVLSAMKNLSPSSPVSIGIAPPVPTSTTSPLSAYPRLSFDSEVVFNQIQNDQIAPDGGFTNPYTVLSQAAQNG